MTKGPQPDDPDFVLALSVEALKPSGDALETRLNMDAFVDRLAAFCAASPLITTLNVFRPDPHWREVRRFDDGPPPDLICEIGFSSREDLDALRGERAFQDKIEESGDMAGDTVVAAFQVHRFAIGGADRPAPRRAPMSFVVRYFGPTPDVPAFGAAYMADHPRLLGAFPGIGNVLCYTPLCCDETADTGVILGNEVTFEDVAALNRALETDVLTELRADRAKFPSFRTSTHHAMRRKKLL